MLLSEDRVLVPEPDRYDYLPEAQVAKLGGWCHPLVGSSSKAKRVSYSTSHAETNAAAKAIPMGQMIALRYAEPELVARSTKTVTPLILEQYQERGECPLMHDHFIDCMDLWELSCGMKGIPQDKGMRLGVLSIREERRSLRLRRLYHVCTHWMLADQFTKFTGYFSLSLSELLSCGWWTIGGDIRVRQGFGSTEQPSYLALLKSCMNVEKSESAWLHDETNFSFLCYSPDEMRGFTSSDHSEQQNTGIFFTNTPESLRLAGRTDTVSCTDTVCSTRACHEHDPFVRDAALPCPPGSNLVSSDRPLMNLYELYKLNNTRKYHTYLSYRVVMPTWPFSSKEQPRLMSNKEVILDNKSEDESLPGNLPSSEVSDCSSAPLRRCKTRRSRTGRNCTSMPVNLDHKWLNWGKCGLPIYKT